MENNAVHQRAQTETVGHLCQYLATPSKRVISLLIILVPKVKG